ncbi:DUF3450 domain-containing protein [Microvirga sesbaniae]|uniref:DUF3450 domain-containing protein n=1 Tax=Microvirga sesbaniae TaxID=681392 RepID=UPI0021C6AD53|nr:DUF3450 domain-containing protein [Microvirga sp. HBU67692]
MSTKDPKTSLVETAIRRSSEKNAADLAADYEKLRLENDDLRFEVSRLQASVERQQQQLFDLNRRLGESYDARDNGVSDREIDRLRAKERLLSEMLESRSWRLTRGYRYLGARIQRLLRS